ncbi:LOW QUALITY PROTEIN: SAP-like protein BP-73 [Dioscorea cayenensis subsp. rotundata]|uniref:LOW QUALITY PROTEIN: SAP-like protein BP-73 n=1 Tax=Dioscorea cayennensis subsp. rotundata TaxID=55577 RepID=A0AB40APN8_DIOCR|nr:LOW QUALITY PROTEIN: SAP-like protein BP-73 [Dioscorea cayenensis subsp. rotundata]
MSGTLHLVSGNVSGYVIYDGKCIPCPGASARAAPPLYSSPGLGRLFHSVNVISKKFPAYGARRPFLACRASSNSQRRNPDFSRQNKGISKGRGRQFHGQDNSQNAEDGDVLSSKNGPLFSLSGNQRYQATATPGKREREIVELFRKVQAQLRERAAIKEEKRIDATQQGQSERGTVDSLLKLLRKHSVDQDRKTSEEDDDNDLLDRSNPFEDERVPNFFDSNNINGEVNAPEPAPNRRPTSNFKRRSPVPRVKFQPVFAADEDENAISLLNIQGKKGSSIDVPNRSGTTDQIVDSVSYVEPNGVSLDVPSYSSEYDETSLEFTEVSYRTKGAWTCKVSRHQRFFKDRREVLEQLIKKFWIQFHSLSRSRSRSRSQSQSQSQTNYHLDVPSYSSDAHEILEEVAKSSVLEPTDLSSLKLSELRDIAKSRSIKGYSKLKKSDLVELLSGDDV